VDPLDVAPPAGRYWNSRITHLADASVAEMIVAMLCDELQAVVRDLLSEVD
jgi:hypothetical protein